MNFYPCLPVVHGVNQPLKAPSHPSSEVRASHFPSYWKPFISFYTILLGEMEYISRESRAFFLLFILPVNANKWPTVHEPSYLQTPQGALQKKINPAKSIKYKFTWSKHRVTGDFSPYLHSTLRPYKWLCKLHQLPELLDKSQCQRNFQEKESK